MKIRNLIKNINLALLIAVTLLIGQQAVYGPYAAYAAGDTVSFNGGIIHVTGKTDSGEAGKKITMIVLKKDKTAEDFFALTDYSELGAVVANIQGTTTTEGGNYSFSVAIDHTYETAGYNVLIDGEGMESLKTLTVECISLSEFTSAIDALDAVVDEASEATSVIMENKDFLGLDISDYESRLGDDDNDPDTISNHQIEVNKFLINKNYGDLNISEALIKIKNDFKMGVGLQLINKATSKEDMEYAIDHYNDSLNLNIDVYSKYEDVTELFKILYPIEFKSIDTLKETFYKQSIINFIKTSTLSGAVKDVIETYSSEIGIDISEDSEYSSVDSLKLYKEFMKNRNFTDYNGIVEAIEEAIDEITEPVSPPSKGNGSRGSKSTKRESFSVAPVVVSKPTPAPEVIQEIVPSNFEDIQNHWAKEDIDYMYSNRFIRGINERTYAPDTSISRAQFVSIIARVLGLMEQQGNVFTDVTDQWFKDDINKALKAGLIAGQPGEFRPEAPITRQELMKIVVSAYQYKHNDYTVKQKELAFADKDKVAYWAVEYISSAVELELVKGINDNGTFYINPTGNTTRAEAAAILRRLVQKMN